MFHFIAKDSKIFLFSWNRTLMNAIFFYRITCRAWISFQEGWGSFFSCSVSIENKSVAPGFFSFLLLHFSSSSRVSRDLGINLFSPRLRPWLGMSSVNTSPILDYFQILFITALKYWPIIMLPRYDVARKMSLCNSFFNVPSKKKKN